jgi:hypothetical protein
LLLKITMMMMSMPMKVMMRFYSRKLVGRSYLRPAAEAAAGM